MHELMRADDTRQPAPPEGAFSPRETPDVETASASYARRFSGPAGRYFLKVQERGSASLLDFPPGTRLLDLGGGHGQLVKLYRARGFDVTVFGSNPCIETLLRTNTHGDTIAFESGDLLASPFEDDAFDVVVAVRLISHIENWPRLVAEMCRIARKSVLIDYPSLSSLNALTPLLFKLKKGVERNTRTYTSFTRDELARVFRAHHFEPAAEYKQFAVPMFVHRACNGHPGLQALESISRYSGMTKLLGSPVLLRMDHV